ncbi:MAG: hypothetical protein IT374_05580 [Polyangiaceae bacterium]|nr:hypothetical protein [Polyangiaceae bacterium]
MSARAARLPAWAALLWVLATPAVARAACGPALVDWARACAAREAVSVEATGCQDGRATLDVGRGSLRIELRADGSGFVSERGVGLSPVGQFADWKAEPAPRREALETARRCVTATPPPLVDRPDATASVRPRAASRSPTTSVLTALGLVLVLAVAARRLGLRLTGAWFAVTGVVLAARWWALGGAFFHQNGQGPLWTALDGHSSRYGPGYEELMAQAVRVDAARPERAIFLANAALGALCPALAFAVARALGLSRGAWLVAAVVALDPIAARVGGSESYFAVTTALAWAAALGVTVAATTPSTRQRWFAIAGAALLVAATARVHPVAWAPLATLALVPLAGARRGAARHVATTAAGIAAGVLLFSGPAMLEVLRGPIGAQWARASSLRLESVGPGLAIAAGVIALLVTRRRSLAPAGALLAVGWTWLTFRLELDDPLVAGAYLRLAAPPVVALALAVPLPRRARALAVALAVGAWSWWLPGGAARARALSTDALEATWALEWRERLTPADDVCYVARAGRAVLALPLHEGTHARATPIDPAVSWTTDGCTHYYRGALCDTPDARDACRDVERGLHLAPVVVRALPARPSLPWLRYLTSEVDVGLFRVLDGRPRAR